MGSGYYRYLRNLLKDRSGLILTPEKNYLIDTRLAPLARKRGYQTIADMVQNLTAYPDEALTVEIVEAMNTHESSFFRDREPFDLFKSTILPQLLQRRADKRHIRVWCAACSSGQEPYSLAMIVKGEAAKLAGWKVDIVATDISHSVLARAALGRYSQFEIQRGLPVNLLVKHFTQDGDDWRVNDDVRKMVTFKPFNLLHECDGLGQFDLVFCRNVMIYFDLETKSRVLASISKVLHKDGVLFLGSAESTMGLTEDFGPVQAGRGAYKHTNGPPCLVEI
ncbi:protein-glutamate O-methyltransferase CheR [Magnetovibrio sp.]|uniref:CheR family methyltransferase n=1 Tax=Magnetovibrio sp. TaxID=2024836 RepID=UPI002F91F3D4